MTRGLRPFGLVALLFALPALAADDPKKDGQDTEKKAPAPTVKSPLAQSERKEAKYQSAGKVAGKMQGLDQTARTIAVEITSGLGRRETREFTLADDVKVRTKDLPVQLDEKDRPKRLTPQEKQKLKGDDRTLPGYTAELSALAKGQVLEVHLSRLKGTAAKKPAAGDRDKVATKDKAMTKDKGKEGDKEKTVDRDVLVTMIVVMTQDNPPGAKPYRK
jgi:hypothetical protein